MNDENKLYWFPARKSGGWGWGVANCWQGALVQLGYPVLAFAVLRYFLTRHQGGIAVSLFLALTVAFFIIHWVKGERPSWRW